MFDNVNQNPFMMPNQDGLIDIDNNSGTIDIDLNQAQSMSNGPMNVGGQDMGMVTTSSPIIEPGRERVINRTFEHIVPHICPIRTKIVNHHVYKHTYRPVYTCSEENVSSNVECGSCCNFR